MPRIEPIPPQHLPPLRRARYEEGAYNDEAAHCTLAYAEPVGAPGGAEKHPNYPNSLLDAKLLELVRIRSAQLGGCSPCSTSRKVDGTTDERVACLIDTRLRQELSARERLALELLERLSADHHGIDDDFYRRMGDHFTIAEIIDLGLICGSTMGMHRFVHSLDFHGDAAPVLPFDPAQIGVGWADYQDRIQAPAQA